MKQNIQLIVSDIDNTLINNEGRLTAYTKHALLGYQRQGYTVMLATGRFLHEAQSIINELQLANYHGYIACCNGSQVFRLKDNTYHTFDMIDIDEADVLMKLAQKHHLTLYIQLDQQYHLQISPLINTAVSIARKTAKLIEPISTHNMRPYLRRLVETNVTTKCSNIVNEKLYKICFLGSVHNLGAYRQEIHDLFPGKYNFFDVTQFSMEIVRSSVSKGNAVQYVCDELGITMKEVIAFGDSGNDESLLEKAGIGITMKNGYGPTIKKASYVSAYTNDEDGVARTLKNILK